MLMVYSNLNMYLQNYISKDSTLCLVSESRSWLV